MVTKRTSSGSSEKTASMTVRLDPKLKYGLEILARKQYRNLSSLVEWALNKALQDKQEGLPFLNQIWDVDEADRFIKLAEHSPELLTFDEQKLWKLIDGDSECKNYYNGNYYIANKVVKENWEKFIAVSKGKAEKSILPGAIKAKMEEELEDEIPF